MDCTEATRRERDAVARPKRTVHTLGSGKKHSMALDTHITFGETFPDSADVKPAIAAIAACVQDRDKSRRWASHLKLLTADIERTTTPRNPDEDLVPGYLEHLAANEDRETASSYCSCNSHHSVRLRKDENVLMLTDVGDLPDCTHYVAVSYSCGSMRDAVYTGSPFSIRTKDGIRPPRCPPALLERVISYTWDHGFRYFWIDQECIDQADENDLETGMQAMDIVYENSMDSVAVLRTTVVEQKHCDALGSMIAFDPDTAAPTHAIDVLEILEQITADVWFQRAWTLQESTSGGTSMTILLSCVPGIEVPTELRRRRLADPNEHVEFGLNHLVVSAATWFEPSFPGCCEDLGPEMALRLQTWQEKWARLLPTVTLDFEADGLMNLCLASEALWHISVRTNSVVADRLAIIANLCSYEVRLDTMKLDELGYDFSICALVLTILNGDTSVLAGVGAYHQGRSGRLGSLHTDIRDRIDGHGASWMLPPTVCLNDVPTKERDAEGTLIELAKIDLLPDGSLSVEGCLWVVDDTISLEPIRSFLLQTRTTLEMSEAISDSRSLDLDRIYGRLWTGFLVDFSMNLLSYLSMSGYSNMVRLLWRELRPHRVRVSDHSLQEVHQYAQASFEQVVDVASRSIKWPAPSWSPLSWPHDPDPSAVSMEPFAVLDSPVILYLMQRMMHRKAVPIARLAGNPSGAREHAAIFDDAAIGDMFFTPRVWVEPSLPVESSSTLSAPLTGYRWYPLCWRVTNEHAQDDTTSRLLLRSHGLRGGAWLADEQDRCDADLT